MNDFFELEKKCKKLQQKKLIKYLTIATLIIIAIAVFFLIFSTKTKEKTITKQPTPTIKPKIIIKERNITKVKVVVKKVYIEKNITKPEVKAPVLNLDINLSKIKDINDSNNIKTPKKSKLINTTKPQQKKSIIQNETITFQKALTLAKKYYENGDYENSIKWCKLASKIDNNDERVWKLYALNLVKTNQKQKAIKVLKTYLKYKDSLELKYLLQRLEE